MKMKLMQPTFYLPSLIEFPSLFARVHVCVFVFMEQATYLIEILSVHQLPNDILSFANGLSFNLGSLLVSFLSVLGNL